MTSLPATELGVGELRAEAVIHGGRGTLRLTGEVDVSNAAWLGETIEGMQRSGASTIVVDMAGLGFIDSSGLHQLVLALRRQRHCDGDLILRAPTPSTLRVLEMVGLNKVFNIT